eukprot:2096216-Pyramimonas_sp.AAC.1
MSPFVADLVGGVHRVVRTGSSRSQCWRAMLICWSLWSVRVVGPPDLDRRLSTVVAGDDSPSGSRFVSAAGEAGGVLIVGDVDAVCRAGDVIGIVCGADLPEE